MLTFLVDARVPNEMMLAKQSLSTSVTFLQIRRAKSTPVHFRASPTVIGIPESPEDRRDQIKILFVRCYNNPLVTGYVKRKARNRRHPTGQDLLIKRQKQRRQRVEQRLEQVEGWSVGIGEKENIPQGPTRCSAVQETEPLRDSIPGSSTFPNTGQAATMNNDHCTSMEYKDDKHERGFCAVNFGTTKEEVTSHFPSLLQGLIMDIEERHDKDDPHRNCWHIYFETPRVMKFVLDSVPQAWTRGNHGEDIHPHVCEIQVCPTNCTKPNDRPSTHSAIFMAPILPTRISEHIFAKSTQGLYIRNIVSAEQIKTLFSANNGVKIAGVQQELGILGESNCWHVIFESLQSMENALQQLPKQVFSELQTIRETVLPDACFIISGVSTVEGVRNLFLPEDVSKIVVINENLTQNGGRSWYIHFASEEIMKDVQQRLLSKNAPGGQRLVKSIPQTEYTSQTQTQSTLHSPIIIEILGENMEQQLPTTTFTPTQGYGTGILEKSIVGTTSCAIDMDPKVECLETSEQTSHYHSTADDISPRQGLVAPETLRIASKSSPISAWGPQPQDRPGRSESLASPTPFRRGRYPIILTYPRYTLKPSVPAAIPGHTLPQSAPQLVISALPITPAQCDVQSTQLSNLEDTPQIDLNLTTQLATKQLGASGQSPVIPNISSTAPDLLNLDEDPLPVMYSGNMPLMPYLGTKSPTASVSRLEHWAKELEGLEWPPSEPPSQLMILDNKSEPPQCEMDTTLGFESIIEGVHGTNAEGYVLMRESETQNTTLGNVEPKPGFDVARASATCDIDTDEPTGVDSETQRTVDEGVTFAAVGYDEDCDWEDIPEKNCRGKGIGIGRHSSYGLVSSNSDRLRRMRRSRNMRI